MTIQNSGSTIFLGGGELSQRRLDEIHALATHISGSYSDPALFRADAEARLAAQIDAIMPSAPRGLDRGWNLDRADDLGIRLDSAGANVSSGVFTARSLEAVLSRTTERKSPLNAERIFNIDSSIGSGAESYRAERSYGYGGAGWHKNNGSKPPGNEIAVAESVFPIHTAVSMFRTNVFELQSASFAGFNVQARKMQQCQRSLAEFSNNVAWFGDASMKVNGALTFPWTPKYVSPVSFADSAITPANADAIIAELNFIVQYAGNQSDDGFAPTDLVLPTQLYNKLKSTRLATRDSNILDWFVANNGYITSLDRIHKAGELANAGGAGQDAIYAYRADAQSGRIIEPQGFTMLPPQIDGFNLDIICYKRLGGFFAEDPGNDLIAYVTR